MKGLPIWVVGGDGGHRSRIVGALKSAGAIVQDVVGVAMATDLARSRDPALVLLHTSVVEGNVLDLCSQFRQAGYRGPILALMPRLDPDWQRALLDAGATEILTEDGSDVSLVVAAVRQLLRVTDASEERRERRVGDVVLDLISERVRHQDQELHLTKTQFRLLRRLSESPGEVVSREALLNAIMVYRAPHEEEPDLNTISSHVSHLRAKLRGTPLRIEAVHGYGYRLYDDPLIEIERLQEELALSTLLGSRPRAHGRRG